MCSSGGGGGAGSVTTSTHTQADGRLGELVDGERLPYFRVGPATYQVQGVLVHSRVVRCRECLVYLPRHLLPLVLVLLVLVLLLLLLLV